LMAALMEVGMSASRFLACLHTYEVLYPGLQFCIQH
jgi:hypothetical protein